MLRSLNELTRFNILATDGEMGAVRDFYFDDQSWQVYAVVFLRLSQNIHQVGSTNPIHLTDVLSQLFGYTKSRFY